MTLSPALIWNAASIALGVIGATLFLWAMFKDRPRGRLRCTKCWYDMKGAADASPNPPWTCPECGKSIRAHKHLRRTRRKLRVAVPCLLLLLLALYGWTARDRVLARGWIGAIPTIALAAFAPMDDATWKSQPTSPGLLLGSGAGTPPSADLRLRLLAELMQRLNSGNVSSVSWRIAMSRAIGPTGSATGFRFTGRTEWPRGVEAWAFVQVPDRLVHLGPGLRLRVRQSAKDTWSVVNIGLRMGGSPRGPARVTASADPPLCRLGVTGGKEIPIEVELLASQRLWTNVGTNTWAQTFKSERVVWRGRASFARVVPASVASMMQPHASESADERVASMIKPMLDDMSERGKVGLLMTRSRSIRRGASEFAIGMRLEVLRDGEVVATATHIHPNFTSSWESPFYTPLDWRVDPPTPETFPLHEWRLNVTGDPEVALRDYETNVYWSGSLSMPLLEFFDP